MKHPKAERDSDQDSNVSDDSLDVAGLALTPDAAEMMARHIAAHLQVLMLLTIRLASLQDDAHPDAEDDSANSASVDHGDSDDAALTKSTGDHAAKTASTGHVDAEMPHADEQAPETVDEQDDLAIPDAVVDFDGVPRQYDKLPVEKDGFLQELIKSGAYQADRDAKEPLGTTSWTNVFRVGEMVWYLEVTWWLGVVIAIDPKPGTATLPGAPDDDFNFTLAPVGHSLLEQASLIKDCQSMRPFLTFSVPDAGMDELRDKTFDKVNWSAMTARLAHEPDPNKHEVDRQALGVEASKLAAHLINNTFSTFDLVAEGSTLHGTHHVQLYRGVYLGAEMVHVGDPLRVTMRSLQRDQQRNQTGPTPASELDAVMLVAEISVATPISSPDSAAATLQFRGNLYRVIDLLADQSSTLPRDLPPVFDEELATRNRIGLGIRWQWALVAERVQLSEQDVRGRFYVNEKVLGIIDPPQLQEWLQAAKPEVAPPYLNSRRDTDYRKYYVGRRPGRKATFGEAVGVEFRVPEGLVEN